MLLSNLSIRRPVFATVMMLALVTLGIASYRRLAVDMFPNVEIPVLTVTTLYPGASPETVEREVTRRVEEAVNPIAGVKHVGSISREGVSQVWVEFELEVRINDVSQDARAKIAAVRGDLPLQIEEPIIEKLDFSSAPIVSLAVRSQAVAPRELTTLVDRKVKRRLQNITGVGKVDLVGAATREVRVEVDLEHLEALAMGIDEVVEGLRIENVDTPLGRLNRNSTEIPLRIQGKARSVPEFEAMTIAQRQGRPVALGEVARITDGIEEQRSLAFVDGVPAVALDVMKQSGANTVGVVDAVRAEIARIQAELPPATTIAVVRDASVFIREAVHDVQQTLVLGGILTVLIVFCFLNSWRSTVITGLTLPISVISAFIAMNFLGMTLNIMTLMALSLAIGLLIDDAIVVRENIVRHLEHGQDHMAAARDGTSEIGLAVMATTFSIVSVFVPVAFMKGIVGRFFFQFGITVTFAVLVSLFVAFTLDPMLSSRWVDPDIERRGRRHALARVLDRFNAWFDRTADLYKKAVGWALDHRPTVMVAAVAAFVGGLGLMGTLQSEFFPQHDQGEFDVTFRTAPSASIDETRDRVGRVLDVLGTFPEVEHTYATIGAGDAGTVRDARIYVKLVDRDQRVRRQDDVLRATRERIGRIPGIVPSFAESGRMDNRKPLLVSIRGDDLDLLKRYAAQLKQSLYAVPGIVDLEATLEHDTPEYRIVVDRERAADAGLNTAIIAGTLAVLVGGRAVSTFEDEEGEARDVRVRLPPGSRQDASQLESVRLAVRTPGAPPALLALGDLARYQMSTTPSEVNRRDLAREVVVSANLDGLPLGTAVQRVTTAAAGLQLAPGYRLVLSGENEAMEESFQYMAEALLLAIVFVYLILAAQFESFIDPLAIMLSLPLSIVGMAGMLALTGDTINIMSLIGLIMLMGLVTKNAILLVDFAKVLRARGLPRREALVRAGRTRLRPIVMTTAAMIFGMLPLALAMGAGAEMRAPMARAIVGGLITSTLLTLLVVPVVYSLLDDVGARVRGWWHRAPKAAQTAGAASVLLAAAFSGGVGPAAAEQAGPRVLTLGEALAIAADQNRDIKQALEYQKWLRAKYVEERAAALPQLDLTADVLHRYDDSQREFFEGLEDLIPGGASTIFPFGQDVRQGEVRVSQVLFTWGQIGAAIRAAKEGIALGQDQLQRQQHAVARDVSTAFFDVLVAREFASIAAQNIEQKARLLEEARRKHFAGTATDYDVLVAQVAVDNARPEAIRTENLVRTARERLRFLLADAAGEVDAEGDLAVPIETYPEYEASLALALQNRPEITELAHQHGIAVELIRIAAAANKPRLDAGAAWGRRSLGVRDIDTFGTTWDAGVYLSFPFFDGKRTDGRVAQARSDAARIELQQAQLADAIAVEVRVAVDAVREAGEIVGALSGTVAQAERLLLMAEKGYEFGVKTNLEVRDAQLNLNQARAGLARAQRDYRVSRVALDWVRGTISLTAVP